MENHDEERIASKQFAENPRYAKPAMVLAATMASGPVLIYNGQEVGEAGAGIEGFSGDDGRTTIFDYWGMPEHQKWMNRGAFDGALLSTDARKLRGFYSRLLNLSRQSTAIRKGQFYELPQAAGFSKRQYAYLRYTDQQLILVVANFEREHILQANIELPEFIVQKFKLKNANGILKLRDLLSADRLNQEAGVKAVKLNAGKLPVSVAASDALIIELQAKP